MPGRVDQLIVKEIAQQDRWVHRHKQNQQRKKPELENGLERLERKDRPRRGRDRLVMTRMEHSKQNSRMHQTMRDIEVAVVEENRQAKTNRHPPERIPVRICIKRGVASLAAW